MANKLFYGDNLGVLRASVASESVDLVYLDPPFNSNASYNVLFKAPSGAQSHAQIEAFDDTWHWNETAERAFDEVLTGGGLPRVERNGVHIFYVVHRGVTRVLGTSTAQVLRRDRFLERGSLASGRCKIVREPRSKSHSPREGDDY